MLDWIAKQPWSSGQVLYTGYYPKKKKHLVKPTRGIHLAEWVADEASSDWDEVAKHRDIFVLSATITETLPSNTSQLVPFKGDTTQ